MKLVTLLRLESTDEGTFGTLRIEGFKFCSGELPWRENESNKSCIPPGTYHCEYRDSGRHGFCYHVDGVPMRSGVEIHAANWVGDFSKGYLSQLFGCIALGEDVGYLQNQKALLKSREALITFEAEMGKLPFNLIIK